MRQHLVRMEIDATQVVSGSATDGPHTVHLIPKHTNVSIIMPSLEFFAFLPLCEFPI